MNEQTADAELRLKSMARGSRITNSLVVEVQREMATKQHDKITELPASLDAMAEEPANPDGAGQEVHPQPQDDGDEVISVWARVLMTKLWSAKSRSLPLGLRQSPPMNSRPSRE